MRVSSAKLRRGLHAACARVSLLAVVALAVLLVTALPLRGTAQENDEFESGGGTGAPRPGVEEIMVIGEVLETSTQAIWIKPMVVSLAFGELFSTLVVLGLVPAAILATSGRESAPPVESAAPRLAVVGLGEAG